VFSKSYFNRTKRDPPKHGAVKLVRGADGGFRHLGKFNNRLELEDLLKKYETVNADRDKYTEGERNNFDPVVSFKLHEEKLGHDTRLAINKEIDLERTFLN